MSATSPVPVADVRLVAASFVQVRTGLLGWLSCRYGGLLIDGVTLRQKSDGSLALSWPARRDSRGRDHPVVRPMDDAARRALEAAILGELSLGGEARIPSDIGRKDSAP